VEDPRFLGELLLLIAIAGVGVALFERFRLPTIAGFLVMGAVVGPGGLALVADPERVRTLAEFGVVFLLFEIGLELPLERVRRFWRRAAIAGGLQISVSVVAVALLALSLGLAPAPAFVLGCIIAMSSTALVMRLLSARGEIDAPQGQLSVGILLSQDLCIVPVLLVIPLLARETPGLSTDAALELGRAGLALGVFFAVARFGLPRVLDWAIARHSRDLFTLIAFLVVVGSAVAAREIGLTLAVGAFVGGLVLSASPYAHQLFAEVVPLRGVLLGLFFTAVGMLLDPAVALGGWSAVLVYVLAVILLKTAVVAGIVALVLRGGLRLGVITGLGLAQTGEFSFVLAAVALEARLLDPSLHQVFIAGSIVTLIATPFLMRIAPEVARRAVRSVGSGLDESIEVTRAEDHVVLLGFGLAGQTVARVLRTRGIPYRAVEGNGATVQEVRRRGEPVVYGDVTRAPLLERLGVANARLVVVAISDPMATREAVRLVRALSARTLIVARTHFLAEVDLLYGAGATRVVAEEFESTLELLAASLRCFAIPESAISRFAAELREEGYEPMRSPALRLDPWLDEILEEISTQWVEVPETFVGRASLEGLEIRVRTGASILAVEHRGQTIPNPTPAQALSPGDRVLAFGTPREMERLRELLRDQDS
jgi:CPA2 family monovalent cation:H+ antiporter-2